MKLAVVLVAIIGTFVLACSTASPGTTPTVPPTTTLVPVTKTLVQPSDNSGNNMGMEFGIGGLVANLEDWADVEVPQFYQVSHIDVSALEAVSKFRSRAGHDYSDSFEECCSLKHYFHPKNFYETALTNPIYSAVDGVILYLTLEDGGFQDDWPNNYEDMTGKPFPDGYKEYQMYIRPDEAPYLWIRHHHISPVREIVETISLSSSRDLMLGHARPAPIGYRVNAGDLIAHGLGEISLEQHLDGTGIPSPCIAASTRREQSHLPGCASTVRFRSIFDHMTDQVFADYQVVSDVVRDDFKVSRAELKANPNECDGEFFINIGNVDDPDVYRVLHGTIQDNAVTSSEQSALFAFEGSGNDESDLFTIQADDVLVISSSGGPIDVTIDGLEGSRTALSHTGTEEKYYQTIIPMAGPIRIVVGAPEAVSWDISIRRPE